MSKYNLIDIFEGFKDSLSSEEKERFDMLTQDDQDKLEKIKIMMDKEKSMNETEEVEEVTSQEGSRIEGLLNIPMKAKFLEAFQDLYFDLVEEDPFMAEDVIDHLSIEMLKHLDNIKLKVID